MNSVQRFQTAPGTPAPIPASSLAKYSKTSEVPTATAAPATSQAVTKGAPMIAGAAQSMRESGESWLSDPTLLVFVGITSVAFLAARFLRR